MWTNTEPRLESVGLLQVLLCFTCIYRCQSRHVEKMAGWVTCYWHPPPQILQYHIDRETCHYWSGRLRILQVFAVSNSNSAHVAYNLFSAPQAVVLVHLMRCHVSTQIICVLLCTKNWPILPSVHSPGRSVHRCFRVASFCSVLLENQQLSQRRSQICHPIKRSRWQSPLSRAEADPRSVLSIRLRAWILIKDYSRREVQRGSESAL